MKKTNSIPTGNVEFLEHLSGFLEVLDGILEKNKLQEKVENLKKK
ncbi:hypothetical protein [Pedobacter psychrodurus]|nr:hypothetical protein [Pedobacter psychrodurus]